MQQDAVKVAALVSVGTAAAGRRRRCTADLAPPVLPPPEDCVESTSTPEFRNGILEQLEVRLDPATAGFVGGTPGGSAESRAWIRARSGREPDPLILLTVADALPPVTFDLGLPGWVPTIELTVLLRGVPAPGWLRCVHRARRCRRLARRGLRGLGQHRPPGRPGPPARHLPRAPARLSRARGASASRLPTPTLSGGSPVP